MYIIAGIVNSRLCCKRTASHTRPARPCSSAVSEVKNHYVRLAIVVGYPVRSYQRFSLLAPSSHPSISLSVSAETRKDRLVKPVLPVYHLLRCEVQQPLAQQRSSA